MKDRLTRYVSRTLLDRADENPIDPAEDLLASGLLDSLGVMSLVHHVEETTGLDVPPEDVVIENFQSIDAICAYLESRGVSATPERTARGDE